MKRFTDSLRSSVANEDWYVALTSALTLPDVCSRLMSPTKRSSIRYPIWFQEWMAPLYTHRVAGIGEQCFLTGDDCYALRCSYLHEGGGNIENQAARKALDNFHFITPPPRGRTHCNRIGSTLQLQVDVFCIDMADAVDRWANSVRRDDDIQSRIDSLLKINRVIPGIEFC